jgi:glutamate racemase
MSYRLRANKPIGIFDSGPGGLAVLQEVRRLLPNEDVLYIGDTARQPYGPRPQEEVRRFAVELTGYLASLGAKAVLIGCNTASVAGWEAAQRAYPEIPVLGMIGPGVRAALVASRNQRIGVWGTELTADSKAYDHAIHALQPDTYVQSVSTPVLLRLCEKGQIDDRAYLGELCREYFAPVNDVDTLVLGCTDLTCVRDLIDQTVGEGVAVVDPAEAVVIEARQILEDANALHAPRTDAPSYQFMITGSNEAEFAAFTERFLNLPHVDVEWVDLREVQ